MVERERVHPPIYCPAGPYESMMTSWLEAPSPMPLLSSDVIEGGMITPHRPIQF